MLKNKKSILILITALIIVEQGIKILINSRWLNENRPILPPLVYFRPMFNRDYSWINSLFQLGIGKWIHILVATAVIVFLFMFYMFLVRKSVTTLLVDTAFAFILSGALCSWIDKVFWNGSLDYIQLKPLFTFDLKDVYISIFTCLILFMSVIDHQGLRKAVYRGVVKDFSYFMGRRKKNP